MKFTSLTQRFLLWFVAVSLLPLLLFGVSTLRQSEQSLRKEMLVRLSNQADSKASQIRTYLYERVHDARILAQDKEVHQAMAVLPLAYARRDRDAHPYEQMDRSLRRLFAEMIDDGGLFYDAFLITPQGEIVYSSKHEADFATNLIDGPYRDTQLALAFRESRMTLENSISDFEHYGPSKDTGAAFVTAPILSEGGVLLGVVALQLDSAGIYRVAMDVNGLGQSGETVLGKLTAQGEALFTAPLRHDPDAALKRKVNRNEAAIPLFNALRGMRGEGISTDYSGHEVIAAWRYLPELRWGMVVKMDAEEAFVPIYRQRVLLIGTLLALSLLAGLTTYFWGRGMVQALKRFALTADRMAGGDMSGRVDVSRSDEIGVLARTFNRMAEKLQALYATLEDRIDERTSELNATNEMLQDEVNERMRSEIELQNNNNELLLYKRFMDASSNAMAMTTPEGLLIYGNRALFDLLGLTGEEIAGCIGKFNLLERYEEGDVAQMLSASALDGGWRGEIAMTNPHGWRIDTQVELFVVKDSNGEPYAWAYVITDISERKRAESLSLRYKTVLDTAQDGYWVADLRGNVLEANAAYARMSGYSIDELTTMHISQLDAYDEPEAVRARIEKLLIDGYGRFETRHRRKDGGEIDIEVSVTYEPDSQRMFVFCRNITERKLAQLQAQHQRELLDEAQRMGHLGSWELNLVSGELYWSDEIYRIFELDPEQFKPSYEAFLGVIHPDDRDKVNQAYTRSLQDRLPYDVEHRLLFPDGRIKWVREHCNSDFDEQGKALRSVGAVQDITEHKFSEDQLRIAAAAFETHEAIMITDADANILRVNRAFEETTGYSAEDVLGKNPRILSSGHQGEKFYAEMWRELTESGTWSGEMWDRRKDGQVYPKWLTITAVRNTQGMVTEYVAIFSDITERKQAEEEIRNLAFYDALTRLPNRRLLLDRFHQALALSARSQAYGAALFLDMDRFKVLNDTLGHDYGDLMLIEVAERITNCVRDVDTVARLGGDEFVVLIEEAGRELDETTRRIAGIAEKIRASLAQPYQLKDSVHHSSPSIGVCLYRGDAEPVDVLLKQADMAMYRAKESGRNTVRFFDPDMQHAVETRATLESDLRRAIADQQLQLYYQIQVDKDFRPLGVEALVRWLHPARGMVSPGQFIPIAEESSLILDIGAWVLETACRQLALWRNYKVTRELTVAVNVSAAQFRRPDFVEEVAAVLRRHGVEPSRLKLELTESVVMADVADVIAKMHALKAIGVKLSMDDFGTGYSSLSYLKKLPLDQVKIDQSFVRDIATDTNDAVMVRTIIDLAQNFGLDVVAEGVETEVQHMFLKMHGCAAYQGYLFSKPVPVGEFEKLLGGLE